MATQNEADKLGPLGKAICLDLPYILDSIWRRAEFNLNRWVRYEVSGNKTTGATIYFDWRAYALTPPCWFFLLTLLFVTYGPTFDAWCSVVGPSGMKITRSFFGIAFLGAALLAWVVLVVYGEGRCRKRFDKAKVGDEERWRRRWVRLGVQAGLFCIAAIPGYFGFFLLKHSADPVCRMGAPAIPSDAPAQHQALLFLCLLAVTLWLATRRLPTQDRIFQQTRILAFLTIILWVLIVPGWASEANQSPYVHIYGAFACALAVIACAARPFAHWQFKSIGAEQGDSYRGELRVAELFPGSRHDPSIARRWGALLTGVFYNLSEFLLLPSFFALMVPSRSLVWTFIGLSGFAAWLLMLGSFTARWQAMVVLVRRWFLLGTPLMVSLSVIVIASLRLWKVQYVTTVLDAAPFGVIFVWIVMAYVLLWWFEFSVNGALSVELIAVLATDQHDLEEGRAKYEISLPDSQLAVRPQQRYIVPHGCGRFVALGYFYDKDKGQAEVAFQTFGLLELFERLTLNPLADHWHDLQRRVALYFLVINAAVISVLGLGFYLYGYGDRHNTVEAVATVNHMDDPAPGADLAALLRARKDKRAFIVAASGGGTRAALFTATALEGLRALGAAQDIVLLSGVSGGGVAEAYFYSHRASLLSAKQQDQWKNFKNHMTEPFIGDVMEGAGEWRLLSNQPLGQLLVESFERRLFELQGGQAKLGQDAGVGLILNTTVTAQPQDDAELLRGVFLASADTDADCNAKHIPYALTSGGRLIFTNLNDRQAFPPSATTPDSGPTHLPDVALPYVVIQDPELQLAKAAALNANFPPVFPNARVDIMQGKDTKVCPRSYYVTDGGATENLGLLSALYALRAALEKMDPADIPEIHIVAIEASATGYDYKPDRGLNAAVGGSKERLTGGLTQELLHQIQALVAKRPGTDSKIHLHDLALPLAFRSRGGFGTHWMFPRAIVVENPQRAAILPWYSHQLAEWFSQDPPTATISQDHLIELWTALHDPGKGFCGHHDWRSEKQKIAQWICGKQDDGKQKLTEDLHIREWNRLIDELHP